MVFLLVPLLLGLSAAAPFLYALQLAPFSLTPDFWIPAERPLARPGVLLSLSLLGLAGLLVFRMRPSDGLLAGGIARGVSVVALVSGVAVFAIYLLLFTVSAHRALFSADQDVTNVSTAIARTTLHDLLPSPYVAAGSSRSFLAHHFSPSLLLFVPAYRLLGSFGFDHNLYDFLLAFVILSGLVLWLYYGYRVLRHQPVWLALLIVPFAHSFLLMRQVVSFHFEVLTLPVFALLLLSLRLQGRHGLPVRARWLARMWPVMACLYLGIKEDMGAYLAAYAGVFLLAEWMEDLRARSGEGQRGDRAVRREVELAVRSAWSVVRRSVYARLLILAVLWTIGAVTMRLLIAGEGAPGWESYWNASHYPPFRKTPYSYALVLVSSGLWLFFSARSLLVVVAVLLLHMMSGMPWHALLESHYSYTLLPFIFAGSVRGMSNLLAWQEEGRVSWSWFVVLLFGGAMVADYAMLREKNHPFGMLSPHPAHSGLEEALKAVPAGACVQSSFHISALVPLRARPLPFTYYEGSPWERLLPRGCQLSRFDLDAMSGECHGLYRLLPGPPGGCLAEEMKRYGDVVWVGEGVLLWRLRQ